MLNFKHQPSECRFHKQVFLQARYAFRPDWLAMLDLAIPLRETIDKSALSEMTEWFSDIPSNAAWYVVSDYCFDDDQKKNDVASFAVLLNHDTL